MKVSRKKGGDKLYKQWVKRGDLPPETIHPSTNNTEDVHPQARKPEAISPRVLYLLFAVSLLMLGAGLIFLLIYSC